MCSCLHPPCLIFLPCFLLSFLLCSVESLFLNPMGTKYANFPNIKADIQGVGSTVLNFCPKDFHLNFLSMPPQCPREVPSVSMILLLIRMGTQHSPRSHPLSIITRKYAKTQLSNYE